jgi:hypothetical protein
MQMQVAVRLPSVDRLRVGQCTILPGEPEGGGAEMDSVLTDTESSTPVDRKWSLSTG